MIIKNGTDFRLMNGNFIGDLPNSTFLLQCDDSGFFLKETIESPVKEVYGKTSIDKWLTARKHISGNMGILLTGLKGSGKTLEARLFCEKSGKSTILIQNPYDGAHLQAFLEHKSLVGANVFFDEFEKVYRKKETEDTLLSLLDGTSNSSFTFIFTSNSKYVSDCLINRPGRIRYRKDYDSISEEIIREVCAAKLHNQSFTEDMVKCLDNLGIATFDLLFSIIQEVNIFNESPMSLIKDMNVKVETDTYDFFFNDKFVGSLDLQSFLMHGEDMGSLYHDTTYHHLNNRTVTKIEKMGKEYIVQNEEGNTYTARRPKPFVFHGRS